MRPQLKLLHSANSHKNKIHLFSKSISTITETNFLIIIGKVIFLSMKTRSKFNHEYIPHIQIHPDSNHPRSHQQPKTNDHRPKRFLTSRQQDIDRRDSVSPCPSIEKELPQLSIQARQLLDQQKAKLIDQLVKQNKLKEQAMMKASVMIELLKDENSQLNRKIAALERALSEREQLIEALEDEARLNQSQDRILGRDIMSDREKQTLRQVRPNYHNYTPREARVKSKSQLFFQFTHSKDKSTRKSQNKIVNADHPTFKDIIDINVSKKLTPCTSKNVTRTNIQPADGHRSVIDELALTVLKEEVQGSRFIQEELNELLQMEREDYNDLVDDIARMEQIIAAEEVEEVDLQENLNKRLFSEQKTANKVEPSVDKLIHSYQKTIQDYKEYAAYLKSYLCEAVNYLNSMTGLSARGNRGEVTVLPLLKGVAKELSDMLGYRLRGLKEENGELKIIMEELIRNIEMSRRQNQPSIHPWSDFGVPIREFQ